jgi:hypothetical protein
MAKDFAAIYASQNDAIALEQKFFLKEEVTRGTLIAPAATDFLFTLSGGTVNFNQPVESSPHRSGRHHTSVIKQKTTTEWTIPTFFNIDTTLGAASTAEIDPAVRLLWKSLMGKEDVTSGAPVYTTDTPPDTTFSIFENGDLWALQAPGGFVESNNSTFPGDGQAQSEWAGSAKTAYLVGIGQSNVDNDGGNTITLESGEGLRMPEGAFVMLIEADGITRSADTPDGSPRAVTSVTGDVVTVDGAALADSNGSSTPLYLAYYEPEEPHTAINDPQTGLQGSVTIVGLSGSDCVRSAAINMVNNHELQDFCYGEEGLGGRLFTPGGRFTAEVTLELNLNKELSSFLNKIKDFAGEDITLILGDAAGRHLQIEVPKAIFPIPEIAVPDTGTIPITFTGNAYQTALDASDEVTVSFL